jgi:hypothetical protein
MRQTVKIDGSRKRRQKSPARLQWYSTYRARRFARRFGCRPELEVTLVCRTFTATLTSKVTTS